MGVHRQLLLLLLLVLVVVQALAQSNQDILRAHRRNRDRYAHSRIQKSILGLWEGGGIRDLPLPGKKTFYIYMKSSIIIQMTKTFY